MQPRKTISSEPNESKTLNNSDAVIAPPRKSLPFDSDNVGELINARGQTGPKELNKEGARSDSAQLPRLIHSFNER